MTLAELKQLAEKAAERQPARVWTSNFESACSPDRILALIALVEDARERIAPGLSGIKFYGPREWLERLKDWEGGK